MLFISTAVCVRRSRRCASDGEVSRILHLVGSPAHTGGLDLAAQLDSVYHLVPLAAATTGAARTAAADAFQAAQCACPWRPPHSASFASTSTSRAATTLSRALMDPRIFALQSLPSTAAACLV